MQDPCEIQVFEFEWDERNETHCACHGVTPVTAEEVKDGLPKFFLNDPGKTASQIMIGPDLSGRFWTIAILPSGQPGRWRPITGWPSDKAEILKYNG
jgi:uncharacterized DUF497 family protein